MSMNPHYRAELEEIERSLRLTNPGGAAGLRKYLDHIDLPPAERRAKEETESLLSDQLRTLAIFCADRDFALMAAAQLTKDSDAAGATIVCCDNATMHTAEVTRSQDGDLSMEVSINSDWPYQRPAVGHA